MAASIVDCQDSDGDQMMIVEKCMQEIGSHEQLLCHKSRVNIRLEEPAIRLQYLTTLLFFPFSSSYYSLANRRSQVGTLNKLCPVAHLRPPHFWRIFVNVYANEYY
jgi:hypothetical protein